MQTQTKDLLHLDGDIDQKLYARQAELERLYNKNQLHRRIQQEFIEAGGFIEQMELYEIPVPFGMQVLTEIALRKRADVKTMVGLLRRHLGDSQETADMLITCAKADLLEYNPSLGQFIVLYEVSDDVQEELDRYQFPLPMVVPPRPIRGNKDTGYLTGKEQSVILRNNHTEDDVCLDHLNRMNRIAFSIDLDTVKMVQNRWRNLDKRKDGETDADFKSRKRAFERFDRVCRDIIEKLTEHGNRHYMTHRYDKRGRVYCAGYHINYQGTPWSKAIVQLADKEFVE